jgi:AcrR family transcriptional regulator
LSPTDERSTREALMDAALEQLQTNGVLAGLNLSEVAEAVGVKPPNIYYYFGSRHGLLRAALARAAARLAAPLAEVSGMGFVERRTALFDAIGEIDFLPMTALLALDDDPEYQPLPFLDATRDYYQSLIDHGELPADIDIEAVHLVSLATSIGVAIYADVAARQVGVEPDVLRARARAVFETLMRSLVAGA